MPTKYSNLNPVQPFGSYDDPFLDRRGSNPVQPPKALPQEVLALHREYRKDRLYFCWLGHSSVFLNLDGKNILIDPVFSRRTSPISFLGPERFPGAVPCPKDFPKIDIVIITHSHYDHLDKGTIKALRGQVVQFVTPTGVGSILRRFGIEGTQITELGWYESCRIGRIDITCTPSQHGSARSPFDGNRTLWGSFVLKTDRFTVFDTGDGGFGNHFEEIRRQFGPMDLAIMECGQYNRRWHPIHMFPEESAQAALMLEAATAIPVHWGAYVLSDHPWDDPPKRFSRRANELGVPCRIPKLNELIVLGVDNA